MGASGPPPRRRSYNPSLSTWTLGLRTFLQFFSPFKQSKAKVQNQKFSREPLFLPGPSGEPPSSLLRSWSLRRRSTLRLPNLEDPFAFPSADFQPGVSLVVDADAAGEDSVRRLHGSSGKLFFARWENDITNQRTLFLSAVKYGF